MFSPSWCIKIELQCQFGEYEQSQVEVEHILQHWDRVQGILLVPVPCKETHSGPDDAMADKQVKRIPVHWF